MKYEPYTGKIFVISVPFGSEKGEQLPYLAISEPDDKGNIEFLVVQKNKCSEQEESIYIVIETPEQNAKILCDKKYHFHESLIIRELESIDDALLKETMKGVIRADVKQYYQAIYKQKNARPFEPGVSRIKYAGRVFDHQEIVNLVDSALDFWLTAGPYAQSFEKEFAGILGIKYCSLVNSGSSANLLAIMALTSPKLGKRRILPGDEVITVAAGFPTTVAPIIQSGAVPVFVDICLPNANVNIDLLIKALSEKTKAVILAHTLGFPFDVEKIKSFCDQNALWFIEDNCDALGSRIQASGKWHYTGTIGHMGTSSFYPPHHITMGEGGAVYTNEKELKLIVDSMRDWGRDCWCPSGHDNTCKKRFDGRFGSLPQGYDHKYVYSHFGYNLKITEMQAAIGCAQLKKLDLFTNQRKVNYKKLLDGLTPLEHVFHFPQYHSWMDPSPFGFLLTIKDGTGFTRNAVTSYLEKRNIQTRNLFAGNIIRHPCFDHLVPEKHYRIVGDLKITDKIMRDAFWLGVYPGMTEEMIDFMIQSICEFDKSGK